MSSNDSVRGITSGTIAVGGSLCVQATGGPLAMGWLLNYVSGSSNTFLVGVSTMSAGYRIGSIPIAIGGGCDLFLNNRDGVTTIVEFVKTLSGFTAY